PMDTIARTSGGWWLMAAVGDPVNNVIPQMLAEWMSDFYNVSLKLSQSLTKAQELRIEMVKNPNVSAQTKPKAGDVMLSHPQTLYPCQQATSPLDRGEVELHFLRVASGLRLALGGAGPSPPVRGAGREGYWSE